MDRPILRYHGGKWRLAPWIIQHFPQHRVYTEPFGGAASVLMRKPRAGLIEIYNEQDPEVTSLFRVLRNPESAQRRAEMLAFTPYARTEFQESYEPADDPVEQTRRTVVRAFMGFGSDSASGALTGFRANGNRNTAHPARDWANYPPHLRAFYERLAGVVIECRPAIEVIRQHDGPQTLHYVDPPYVHDTRSSAVTRSGKGYRHEMTDAAWSHCPATTARSIRSCTPGGKPVDAVPKRTVRWIAQKPYGSTLPAVEHCMRRDFSRNAPHDPMPRLRQLLSGNRPR